MLAEAVPKLRSSFSARASSMAQQECCESKIRAISIIDLLNMRQFLFNEKQEIPGAAFLPFRPPSIGHIPGKSRPNHLRDLG